MRNAFLASASAIALALGGCSMFHHGETDNAANAGQSSHASAPMAAASQTPSALQGGGTQNQAPQATGDAASASRGSSTMPDHTSQSSSSDHGGMATSGSSMSSSHAGTHTSMNADQVKEAQQKLKDDGDYTGQVDGKFGRMTTAAVKQYQQKNGLRQTGRLDEQTLNKLGVSSTSGSGSSAAPSSGSNADHGMNQKGASGSL